MSEASQVTKAAGVVGAATFLSRILGLIRDQVLAWFFGAGLAADAFLVAFRIPNLLRRLFAEGSLTIAFIPVFTQYLTKHGEEEAFDLARSAWWLLAIMLIVVTALGILLAPVIVKIIAFGFTSPEKFELTVFLTRIMFPYIFFVSLVALAMGVLNALGHFSAPALAPSLLNVAMIGSVLLISPHLEEPSTGLALGVVIGGVLQLGLQVPILSRKGFRFFKRTSLQHPALKRIAVLMTPAVLGASVYQISNLVDTLLASLLPEGSVSYLYYADRLVQFPLGVFAIALATAVLPSLSRQAALGDMKGLRDSFLYTVNLVFFITIPATIGLIILREPVVRLLFERGAFDRTTTVMTAEALLFYAMGLWAVSGGRILASTFYSLQDTRTPVRIAVLSLLTKIILSLLLMGPMRHGGLALATSLASGVNLLLLIVALKKRLGRIGGRVILRSISKSMGSGILMAFMLVGAAKSFLPNEGIGFSGLLIWVTGATCGGALVYFGFAFLFKSSEALAAMELMKRWFRQKQG